ITQHESAAGAALAIVKGAPEAVVALAASARAAGGDVPLDDAGRAAVLAAADGMASEGLRVLAFAVARGPSAALDVGALRGRAILLGLVGEVDPPREGVLEAVRACREAGIR